MELLSVRTESQARVSTPKNSRNFKAHAPRENAFFRSKILDLSFPYYLALPLNAPKNKIFTPPYCAPYYSAHSSEAGGD